MKRKNVDRFAAISLISLVLLIGGLLFLVLKNPMLKWFYEAQKWLSGLDTFQLIFLVIVLGLILFGVNAITVVKLDLNADD